MAKEQTIIAVPAGAGAATSTESRTSKFKSFFKKDKKTKIVLSERDAQVLAQVKRRAKVMDTGLNLGFARVGLDPILGLVPVAGDAVSMFMAMRLIHTAQKADIPKSLTQKMLMNVAVDFGLGLVPLVGDIGDFFFKANDRNAKLFEKFLYERAATQAAAAEAAAARSNLATPATAAASVNQTVIQMEPYTASGRPIAVK
ncbi:hypothetical protein BGZ51_001069 [Haplosporangium sp. Z 767]|nr:hypothetical protein BGZ51_001069 [Haplosporangium sp. Z 767]